MPRGRGLSRNQFLSIVGTLSAIAIVYLTWNSTAASIDYWWRPVPSTIYFPFNENYSIDFNVKNGGESDGNFNVIVSMKNATFSILTEQPYTKENDTKIIFPYLLHKTESDTKTIYFTKNQDVSGFSLELTAEKRTVFGIEKLNPIYPIKLIYKWSNSINGFILTDSK